MIDVPAIQTKLTALDASLQQLLALTVAPDLQPVADQIDAIQAEIDKRLTLPAG